MILKGGRIMANGTVSELTAQVAGGERRTLEETYLSWVRAAEVSS